MNVKISKLDAGRLHEAAAFIAERNKNKTEHIGYCGTDADEIADSLMQDLTDYPFYETFLIAETEKGILGIAGLDIDTGSRSAEVWGPFILPGYPEFGGLLWQKLKELLPDDVNTVRMFPNKENSACNRLALEAGLTLASEQSVLVCRMPKNNKSVSSIHGLQKEQHLPFQELHEAVFPNAYYSAQEIIERQEKGGKVLIWEQEGEILGYVYGEAASEHGEASIEFLAVREKSRGNGVGEALLSACLDWLFSIHGIEAVDLCVDSTNEKALRLYRNAGFEVVHQLYFYSGQLRP